MEAKMQNKHLEKRKLKKKNQKKMDNTEENFEFHQFKYSISSTKWVNFFFVKLCVNYLTFLFLYTCMLHIHTTGNICITKERKNIQIFYEISNLHVFFLQATPFLALMLGLLSQFTFSRLKFAQELLSYFQRYKGNM